MKPLLLAILLLLPLNAQADYVNKKRVVIDSVYVVNPWMSLKTHRRMIRNVAQDLRAAGIRVVRGKTVTKDDPFETFSSGRLYGEEYGDPWLIEFNYWDLKLSSTIPNWTVLYVASPPWWFGNKGSGWVDGGAPWYGGRAFQGRAKNGGIAYGSAAEIGAGGQSKYRQSLLIAKHEVLHSLGASHIDSARNVMHSNAQAFQEVIANQPILKETVDQVAGYLN